MATATFNMKVAPKKSEESKFINFHEWSTVTLEQFNGKIVYMNFAHPDKHIYRPYYINNATAHAMSFNKNSNWEAPFFTLDELSYEDVIIYWNSVEVEEKQKANIAASKSTKP